MFINKTRNEYTHVKMTFVQCWSHSSSYIVHSTKCKIGWYYTHYTYVRISVALVGENIETTTTVTKSTVEIINIMLTF